MINDLQEYQDFTDTTAIYPKDMELEYISAGLLGEVGEMAQVFKRWVRDSDRNLNTNTVEELRGKYIAESGDVLWYIARYCQKYGMNLARIVQQSYKETDEMPVTEKAYQSTVGYHILNMSEDVVSIFNVTKTDGAVYGNAIYGNACNNIVDPVIGLVKELIMIGEIFEFNIKDVYQNNYNKLTSRKKNDTLKGAGDDR